MHVSRGWTPRTEAASGSLKLLRRSLPRSLPLQQARKGKHGRFRQWGFSVKQRAPVPDLAGLSYYAVTAVTVMLARTGALKTGEGLNLASPGLELAHLSRLELLLRSLLLLLSLRELCREEPPLSRDRERSLRLCLSLSLSLSLERDLDGAILLLEGRCEDVRLPTADLSSSLAQGHGPQQRL